MILKQFAGHVISGSVSSRSHIDAARIGFGIGDEFGNGAVLAIDGLTSMMRGSRTNPRDWAAHPWMKLKLRCS